MNDELSPSGMGEVCAATGALGILRRTEIAGKCAVGDSADEGNGEGEMDMQADPKEKFSAESALPLARQSASTPLPAPQSLPCNASLGSPSSE